MIESMRPLRECSGPWVGWSVQYNRKIYERMTIQFSEASMVGNGEDADGEFEITGDFDLQGEVALVRSYTFCVLGPEGIGIPYLYRGRWDGLVVSGEWKPVSGPYDGGAFEMWPEEPLTIMQLGEVEQREPVGV